MPASKPHAQHNCLPCWCAVRPPLFRTAAIGRKRKFRWLAFQAGREIAKDATARDMLNASKDVLALEADVLVRLLGAVNNACN